MEIVFALIIVLILIGVGYSTFLYVEKRQAKGVNVLPEVKSSVPMPEVKPTKKETPAQEFSRQYQEARKPSAPVSPSRMGAPAPTSYSRPAPSRSETVDTSSDYLNTALIVSSFDNDTYSRPSVDTSSSSSYSSDSCSPSRDYSSYSSSSYSSDSSSSYDSGSSSSSSSSCD